MTEQIIIELSIEEPISLDITEESPTLIHANGCIAILDLAINADLNLIYNISKL